jgi:predicted DNA-binding transcriptional regulator YafY
MPRNAAMVRQWKVLRELDSRRLGASIQQLQEAARDEDGHAVSTRTIFRDVRALQDVGFQVYSEPRDEGRGEVVYKLDQAPFKRLLQTGFSLSELCALYVSRSVVETLTGLPFQTSLREAFHRLEQDVITPRMLEFLGQLPQVLSARPMGGKVRRSPDTQHFGDQLLEAALKHRVVQMTYFSVSHDRKKEYVVHPLKLVHAHGAFYLYAFVPEYDQIRTFATHRIRHLAVLEDTFEVPNVEYEPYGPRIHVVLWIDRTIAQQVKERQYDPSQQVTTGRDGSLRLELDMANDPYLKTLILGFGARARVLEPQELADEIQDELKTARRQYDDAAVSEAFLELSTQGWLPFRSSKDAPEV